MDHLQLPIRAGVPAGSEALSSRLVPKGSHLADGLDEMISQRSAARRAVQRLDLALVRHKVLYYRMEVRELVGPSLVWTPRP
jgi:hypothetical protein